MANIETTKLVAGLGALLGTLTLAALILAPPGDAAPVRNKRGEFVCEISLL